MAGLTICWLPVGGKQHNGDVENLVDVVAAMSDTELAELAVVVKGEWHRRAVEQGDVEALCEQGFAHGFNRDGTARDPFVVGQVIVCPGGKVGSSAMTHRCRFVAVGKQWVWEADDKMWDEIRFLDKNSMQSVSLLPYEEGLELQVISSKAQRGAHERQKIDGFIAQNGHLYPRGQVASAVGDHR